MIKDIAAKQGGKYEAVIRDIIVSRNSFTLCNFAHEKRDSNYEARNLVRFASSLDQGRHTWPGLPHDTFIFQRILINKTWWTVLKKLSVPIQCL